MTGEKMYQEQDLTVNHLPVRTWNRLRMNDAQVTLPPAAGVAEVSIENAGAYREKQGSNLMVSFADIMTGMGSEAEAWLTSLAKESGEKDQGLIRGYRAERTADGQAEHTGNRRDTDAQTEVLRLRYTLSGAGTQAAFLGLEAAEGARMQVVMDFRGVRTDEETASQQRAALFQTKIRAAAGSRVSLTQICRAGEGVTLLNDVGASCAEGAEVEVIHVVLSGENTLIGCRADLLGTGSALQTETGYLVTGDHRLDMNYIANHFGRKTLCEMNALGVLREEAHKLYRGTIDFRQGCAGAKGNEKEDVLLMDDGITNQTIPLILCAEEDVEGNHGATIGQLDEDTLFYLSSRGIPEAQIYEMMEKSRLATVIGKIPDPVIRRELLEELEPERASQ